MFGPGRNKNFQNFAMGAGIRQNKKRIDKKTDFLYSVLIAFASEKGRLPKEVGRPIKAALFFRRESFFAFAFYPLRMAILLGQVSPIPNSGPGYV